MILFLLCSISLLFLLHIPVSYGIEESLSVLGPGSYNDTRYLFYYDVENSTVIDKQNPYNDFSFGFNTTLNTDGFMKFKAPKNYPYDQTYDPVWAFFTFMNGTRDDILLDKHTVLPNDCFYEVDVFVGDIRDIAFFTVWYFQGNAPSHTLDVPDKCLSQTIEGYKTMDDSHAMEIWKNIRGESVSVFSSSVEKLIQWGYLV